MIRKILIGLFVILVIIQFIRPARNSGQAAAATDITHYVTTPDTILHLLQRSCYDCHSNHTEYPWYSNINPVSLWLGNHIEGGKKAINFSDVSILPKRKLDHRLGDVAKEVEKKDMPLPSYTLIHTYAKLDDGQIQLIKSWTESARKELAYQPETDAGK